ncbi:EAL domain-containing protein [Alteromonas sp. H39]|uniref:bifunctional diguanylate cyclase/phosphodiesterase n=1 Tax=Alteromonas sp. H39 TaxID=3389876 RepID=UPI0039E13D84
MPGHFKHRVYALPASLCALLLLLFIAAGFYLDSEEKQARISKAHSVAEQVKISLEVIAAERRQALLNLMQNWPTFEPNQVDWFNAQAVSLLGMQKGFSSITFANQTGVIEWVTTPSYGVKSRLSNNLIGEPMSATGVAVSQGESFSHALVYSPVTEHHYIVIGRAISPQEPEHGFLIAGFDVQTILAVMLGELVGPQFNFVLRDADVALFSSGQIVPDGTEIQAEPFTFLEREWTLTMQSEPGNLSSGPIIVIVGVLMSLVVSWVLHKQLQAGVNLTVSQQRYKMASEASLDALLIYQPVGTDFKLVESNQYAQNLFCSTDTGYQQAPLSQQFQLIGHPTLIDVVRQVAHSETPDERYLKINSPLIDSEWLKIQVVKAGENIALTARDVTARFNAQQALKESEERYRRLIDGMHRHFVYTKEASHRFIYASAGVQAIMGVEPDYFCVNEHALVQQVPDETREIRKAIAAVRKPEPYLVHYRAPEGDEFVIEYADTPIVDDNGTLVAVEGIARDVTNEKKLQAEVIYQANHDQLTGLMNRYAFDNQLRDFLSEVKRGEEAGVMCFIDMDRFKLVNDSCGHPAGDKLLKAIAGLFQEHVSENDLLARIGGDEFCIIYRHQSVNDVKGKLDNLLNAISAYRFTYDDKLFFIGASIGVIEIGQQSGSAASLIKAADNACYKAKYLGRNRYYLFDENSAQQEMDNTESAVLNALHQALQDDTFVLFSQAILPLKNKEKAPLHYEILLRLPAQDNTLISPGLFIPLAERHGLMNKIDWWVFENTLATLEQHPHHIDALGKVAINLSGLTLGDETMLERIVQRIKTTSVPAEKVCFEITETTAVTNLSSAQKFIESLRELGCRFALDDFGAGMSSFTYLKNLDVDYIKIDGSFVRNMARDQIDHATVKAINNIAHSMGKQTVAEFVVDAETCECLADLNVDYGQGFALDKPKPLQERLART